MIFLKHFDTLANARTAGSEGMDSPHLDTIVEKNVTNIMQVDCSKFGCEYSDNGEKYNYWAKIPTNDIWYTSSDGNVVAPNDDSGFGAELISNTYSDGKGVIVFDGSVTSIGNYRFEMCTTLTSVTIPSSVTSIGYSAFYSCTSLTNVYCNPTTPPTLESDAFKNNASSRYIRVPSSSVSTYKSAPNWSSYADYIVSQ